VAAHFWNGVLAVQAPHHLGALLAFALEASGRPLAGLTGPQDQVASARRLLGAESRPAAVEEPEGLFSLELSGLRVPDALRRGVVRAFRPSEADIPLLIAWHAAYRGEALGEPESTARSDAAREGVRALQEARDHWLLREGETPVATSAFNARLPEIAQVGGVWTPPEKRGRGYGRAVVAASLLDARAEGVRQAVLFTSNPAARRAYEALGFRQVGEYGLVIFK